MNDPIADSVRSILDGHIVLTRELATQNHYPAIDVLASVSRLDRDLWNPEQLALVSAAREALAIYRKNQDLINIGRLSGGEQSGHRPSHLLAANARDIFATTSRTRAAGGQQLGITGHGHAAAAGTATQTLGPFKMNVFLPDL